MGPQSFAFEQLEGRSLFSVVLPFDSAGATPMASLFATPYAKKISNPLAGAFNVSGTFTHPIGPIGNPDGGSHYHFKGSGHTTALGNFTLAGDVTTPGFIASGRASGQLVITTSHGTITVTVKGPPQSPGSLPPSLNFSIKSGTGKYAGKTGKGKITISASGTTHKFLFRFNQPA